MEANLRAGGLNRLFLHVHDSTERFGARRVEVDEAQPELAAAVAFFAPHHLALRGDLAARARVEAAEQRLADLGQVGRAKVHPFVGHVHGLRLERRPERGRNLDERLERNSRCAWRAAIALHGHGKFLRPFRDKSFTLRGPSFRSTIACMRWIALSCFLACTPPVEEASAPSIDPASLVLPSSTSAIAANEDLPTIILTKTKLLVVGVPRASMSVPFGLGDKEGPIILPLRGWLKHPSIHGKDIAIAFDSDVTAQNAMEVMATCLEAGMNAFHLAVSKEGATAQIPLEFGKPDPPGARAITASVFHNGVMLKVPEGSIAPGCEAARRRRHHLAHSTASSRATASRSASPASTRLTKPPPPPSSSRRTPSSTKSSRSSTRSAKTPAPKPSRSASRTNEFLRQRPTRPSAVHRLTGLELHFLRL